MITVLCDYCQKQLKCSPEHVGKSARCPHCQNVVHIYPQPIPRANPLDASPSPAIKKSKVSSRFTQAKANFDAHKYVFGAILLILALFTALPFFSPLIDLVVANIGEAEPAPKPQQKPPASPAVGEPKSLTTGSTASDSVDRGRLPNADQILNPSPTSAAPIKAKSVDMNAFNAALVEEVSGSAARMPNADLILNPQFAPAVPASSKKPIGDIEFPSGRVFNVDNFVIVQKPASGLVSFAYPSGAGYVVAEQTNGIINGVLAVNYENQKPLLLAQYANGQRHGVLKTWKANGHPYLFGQFVKGRPNGFVCYFHEGDLGLIIEYKMGAPEWIQYVDQDGTIVSFASMEAAHADPAVHFYLETIALIERDLKKDEAKFKKMVLDYEKDLRFKRSKAMAPTKRNNALDRIDERHRQQNIITEQIRQKVHGR